MGRLVTLTVITGLVIAVYILLPKSASIIDDEPQSEMIYKSDYDIVKVPSPPGIPGFEVDEYYLVKKNRNKPR